MPRSPIATIVQTLKNRIKGVKKLWPAPPKKLKDTDLHIIARDAKTKPFALCVVVVIMVFV